MFVGRDGGAADVRKQFFFEKKNQKTFATKSPWLPGASAKRTKFFASFFHTRSAALA
jgi:hypothetical protein